MRNILAALAIFGLLSVISPPPAEAGCFAKLLHPFGGCGAGAYRRARRSGGCGGASYVKATPYQAPVQDKVYEPSPPSYVAP